MDNLKKLLEQELIKTYDKNIKFYTKNAYTWMILLYNQLAERQKLQKSQKHKKLDKIATLFVKLYNLSEDNDDNEDLIEPGNDDNDGDEDDSNDSDEDDGNEVIDIKVDSRPNNIDSTVESILNDIEQQNTEVDNIMKQRRETMQEQINNPPQKEVVFHTQVVADESKEESDKTNNVSNKVTETTKPDDEINIGNNHFIRLNATKKNEVMYQIYTKCKKEINDKHPELNDDEKDKLIQERVDKLFNIFVRTGAM